MKYRYISAVIVAFMLTSVCTGAFSQPRANTSHALAEHATFFPMPYKSGSNLPPNFKGININKLWRFFESKQNSLIKGEYETTAAYEGRLSKSVNDMAPLSPDKEYAFLLPDIFPKYDADTQTFDIQSLMFCQKTPDFGDNKGWATCTVGNVQSASSSYVGSNAFGVTMSVDKTKGNNLAIAVRDDSPFLQSNIFSHNEHSEAIGAFDLKTGFSYPIDKSRALKNEAIGVLLVGKFNSEKFITGRPMLISPTINDPTDMSITEDAVPFTPTAIVYYVERTGRVLATTQL